MWPLTLAAPTVKEGPMASTEQNSGSDFSRIVNHVLAPPVGTFEVDPVHTFVAFRAQHLVVVRVRGRFDAGLHGVTRPLELTVRFGGAAADAFGNVRLAFHATGAATRADFGLTFELLKDAGSRLVGKDIAIEIDAEAIRPLQAQPEGRRTHAH